MKRHLEFTADISNKKQKIDNNEINQINFKIDLIENRTNSMKIDIESYRMQTILVSNDVNCLRKDMETLYIDIKNSIKKLESIEERFFNINKKHYPSYIS
jgi:chromosome segregation ATPase